MQNEFLRSLLPQNLVEPEQDPKGEEKSTDSDELRKQLTDLSIGSGILDLSQADADLDLAIDPRLVEYERESQTEALGRKESYAREPSFLKAAPDMKFPPSRVTSKAPSRIFGSPPKIPSNCLPGAFFSQGNSLGTECPLDLPDQKNRGSISPNSADSDLKRSRTGSTRYVPPAARGEYSSEAPRDSDQDRFRQWLSWDNKELEKRKRALLGKTVVGKLSPKRGNRYFVKWNINANDTVVISADKVEEVLGDTPPAGMWVSCTIVGLGPGHVQWNKQHPYAMTLESRETRASHQPGRGTMPRNSPHWMKSQKAGITREVKNEPNQRATVPAEIDMARYTNSLRANQVPRTLADLSLTSRSRTSSRAVPSMTSSLERSVTAPAVVVIDMPPPEALPKGIVLPQTVPQPENQTENLARRTNGANINLVTGQVRQRGRADTVGSWRRRDRSFTV